MKIQLSYAGIFLILAITILSGCASVQTDPVNKQITCTWTAPGDDGIVGVADQYDGRMAFTRDSLENFWSDCRQWPSIITMPPAPAGTIEAWTFQADVLIGDTIFFAIKAADEVPNWAGISNIHALFWPDDEAPAAILDLH